MNTKLIEAARLALETLEQWDDPFYKRGRAITTLRAALEQPVSNPDEFKCPICYDDPANIKQPAQDEPVAYKVTGKFGDICSFRGGTNIKKGDLIYTRPQAREPLTVEQIDDIGSEFSDEFGMIAPDSWEDFARAIEAAHGIGEKK